MSDQIFFIDHTLLMSGHIGEVEGYQLFKGRSPGVYLVVSRTPDFKRLVIEAVDLADLQKFYPALCQMLQRVATL